MAKVPTIRRGQGDQGSSGRRGAHFSTPVQEEPQTSERPAVHSAIGTYDDTPYDPQELGFDGYYMTQKNDKPRTGRTVALVLLVILLALGAVGGVVGFRLYQSAKTVRSDANAMVKQIRAAGKALESGDAEKLTQAANESVVISDRIEAEVNKPEWGIAQAVPVLGDDVKIVRTMGAVASDLANNALVPVADGLAGVKISDLIQDNRINAELFSNLAETLSNAVPALQRSLTAVDELPEPHIPQVQSMLAKVSEPLEGMRGFITEADAIIRLVPAMLGANGAPRHYLVIAQNNAESRSTGGLPGSWGVVTVENGGISMGEFSSILHWPNLSVTTDAEEKATFKTNYETDPAQVNCVADFVRVGEMAREYWLQAKSENVDGVFAVDPVFLQWMLKLTGGITDFDEYVIDGDNAAEVLLSKAYWWYRRGQDQDYFFSYVAQEAASAVFDNLSAIEVGDLLDVISRGLENRRLYAWMADAEEEALIKRLGAAGELSDDPAKPVLGVYINDETWSKMSWYIALDTTVGEGSQNADGTTTYHVTTTMTNTITESEAYSANLVVYGGNGKKRSQDDMLDMMYFIAPAGGTITNFQGTNMTADPATTTYRGLQVIDVRTALLAGESAVFDYDVTVSAEAAETLAVRSTALGQVDLQTTNAPLG